MRRAGRDHVGTPGFRTRQRPLVPTRRDAEVSPVADLSARYRQRWQVETALAQLKTPMPMAVLHGQTVPGGLKELTVCAIVDNLVRLVMCQSALRQHLGMERLSVLEALRWPGAPTHGIPLEALIVKPLRPPRVEPRVTKRRPKRVPLLITPRQERRQPWVQQALSGELHAIRARA